MLLAVSPRLRGFPGLNAEFTKDEVKQVSGPETSNFKYNTNNAVKI